MKLNAQRIGILCLLLALSVGFGLAFDAVATAFDRHRYPQNEEYADLVESYAQAYALPQAVVWATVKTESDFLPNKQAENGALGLMQITPERFAWINRELLGHEDADSRLLYAPDTNLEAGCAWLSYLYEYYAVWDLTFAAYRVGTETVDAWLVDPDLVNEEGILKKIPDPELESYVKNMKKAFDSYTKLYYQS